MMKFKNSKRQGRWFFRTGSRRRKIRIRSRKPGKWVIRFKFGSKKPNKMRKLRKLPKMKKMGKMSKMSKMSKMKKMNKVARLPKLKMKHTWLY